MTPKVIFTHKFVEFIPNDLADKTIYVSIDYATAAHKCACGCGHEVVTPFTPTDWELIFDGESISLDPSIGNWSFPCRSHYWIIRNRIKWARQWSEENIKNGRAYDSFKKRRYFEVNPSDVSDTANLKTKETIDQPKKSFWEKFKEWFS